MTYNVSESWPELLKRRFTAQSKRNGRGSRCSNVDKRKKFRFSLSTKLNLLPTSDLISNSNRRRDKKIKVQTASQFVYGCCCIPQLPYSSSFSNDSNDQIGRANDFQSRLFRQRKQTLKVSGIQQHNSNRRCMTRPENELGYPTASVKVHH